jgi:hypothetical protein
MTHARRENLNLAQIKTKRSPKKAAKLMSNGPSLKDDLRSGVQRATEAETVGAWPLTVIVSGRRSALSR